MSRKIKMLIILLDTKPKLFILFFDMNGNKENQMTKKKQEKPKEEQRIEKFYNRLADLAPSYNLDVEEILGYMDKHVNWSDYYDEIHAMLTFLEGKKLKEELFSLRKQFSQKKITILNGLFKIFEIREYEKLLSLKKDVYYEHQKKGFEQVELLDVMKYVDTESYGTIWLGKKFPLRNSIANDLNDATFLIQDLTIIIQSNETRFYQSLAFYFAIASVVLGMIALV